MNILILYTRLTDYWMACMRFSRDHDQHRFLVYRKPPSKEAPFSIKSEAGIEVIDYQSKEMNTMRAKIKTFEPNLIYVAGWTISNYLKIAKHYRKKGLPVIVGLDNHWKGNLKQHLGSIVNRWFLRSYFSHIWIPGDPQYPYAKKLGFSENHILKGLYCADGNLFKQIQQTKRNNQFIFIGRMVKHKGLEVLFEVLENMIRENTMDFTMHFVGNGPLERHIPKHKNIKHTPFVPPSALGKLLENAGYFLLPSLYEAWGLVVHEAVLAGLPIITTLQTGAASAFVKQDYNGSVYDAKDRKTLENILKKYSQQTEEDYFLMSENSKSLAEQINHELWSKNLNAAFL